MISKRLAAHPTPSGKHGLSVVDMSQDSFLFQPVKDIMEVSHEIGVPCNQKRMPVVLLPNLLTTKNGLIAIEIKVNNVMLIKT
jgi:hypothetical protein